MDEVRVDEDEPDWSREFLDFPTAWWLAPRVEHGDPRCSYAQTGGALLCDCGAVEAEWHRRRVAVDPDTKEDAT